MEIKRYKELPTYIKFYNSLEHTWGLKIEELHDKAYKILYYDHYYNTYCMHNNVYGPEKKDIVMIPASNKNIKEGDWFVTWDGWFYKVYLKLNDTYGITANWLEDYLASPSIDSISDIDIRYKIVDRKNIKNQ